MTPARIGPDTGPFSDPPTQGERQAFAAYVESLRAVRVGWERDRISICANPCRVPVPEERA